MKLIRRAYKHFNKDSLYRNSIYLMASTAVLAGFGFFFWVVVARLFKTEEVGVATTLISVTTLISGFALLGLNVSLVRFLPKSDRKNEMISTSFILVGIASLVATAVFLLKIDFFSPQLLFLRSNIVYIVIFVLFILITTASNILDSVYMAHRASENILFRNTVLSILKIAIVFLFIAYGAYGIFTSFALSAIISFIVGVVVLIYKYDFHPLFKINSEIIHKLGKYSIGNYLAGFFYQAPSLILPIIIINSLHAKVAAYYYIDSMILNLLIVIPVAASQSLFTEGSHDESQIREQLGKAIKLTILLFLPAIPTVLIFGGYILHFFGANYQTDAFTFLQIISLSAVFMSVVLFGNAVLRIRHKIKALIFLNLMSCIIVLTTTYSLIPFKLVGVGWGWTIGQMVVAFLYLLYLAKFIVLTPDKSSPDYQHISE